MMLIFHLVALWVLKMFYKDDDSQDQCDRDFAGWIDKQIRILQEEISK